MNVQFVSRNDKVSSLRDRLAILDTQIAAQEERIRARQSMIRSTQVEQGQRADVRRHREFGYPHPKSHEGRVGLHDSECRIVGHRNMIIDINGTVRRLNRQRNVLLAEIRYEENILASAAPLPRDRRPVPRL